MYPHHSLGVGVGGAVVGIGVGVGGGGGVGVRVWVCRSAPTSLHQNTYFMLSITFNTGSVLNVPPSLTGSGCGHWCGCGWGCGSRSGCGCGRVDVSVSIVQKKTTNITTPKCLLYAEYKI